MLPNTRFMKSIIGCYSRKTQGFLRGATRAAEAALAREKFARFIYYCRFRFFLKIERIRKKKSTPRPANSTPYQPKVEVMNRVIRDCQDIAVPEQTPKFLGRNLFMLLTPRPSTKAKQQAQQEQSGKPAQG